MKLWRKKMAFDMEEQFSEECVDSGIHEECGVFGAFDFDGNDIASRFSLLNTSLTRPIPL